MELPRRSLVAALIALGVLAATAAVAMRGRSPPPPAVEHAYPLSSPDRRILVEVLNATVRPSLARAATRVLRRRGLDVVFFGNAEGRAADSTRVIGRRGDRAAAERVMRALGQGVVSMRPDTLRRVDVTVLLGEDYRPPADGHP